MENTIWPFLSHRNGKNTIELVRVFFFCLGDVITYRLKLPPYVDFSVDSKMSKISGIVSAEVMIRAVELSAALRR